MEGDGYTYLCEDSGYYSTDFNVVKARVEITMLLLRLNWKSIVYSVVGNTFVAEHPVFSQNISLEHLDLVSGGRGTVRKELRSDQCSKDGSSPKEHNAHCDDI